MGDATPSLESLRDIIERWRVTQGWFLSLLSVTQLGFGQELGLIVSKKWKQPIARSPPFLRLGPN
jgi:hypothetical protein